VGDVSLMCCVVEVMARRLRLEDRLSGA